MRQSAEAENLVWFYIIYLFICQILDNRKIMWYIFLLQMTSVERVMEYGDLPSEADLTSSDPGKPFHEGKFKKY